MAACPHAAHLIRTDDLVTGAFRGVLGLQPAGDVANGLACVAQLAS